MNKTINTPAGWKPHVVYEFVDVKRQTLVYWRDNVFPQNDKKHFTTYDILIYKIIKEYAIRRGIQISRIKKIDWQMSVSSNHKRIENTLKNIQNKVVGQALFKYPVYRLFLKEKKNR